MRPQSLVASPSAIGSKPLASGSRVPPWPTLVLGSPPWRRMRLTALTAVVEPRPTGLSRMIQPWSISPKLQPEDSEEDSGDLVDDRRDDAGDDIGMRRGWPKHQEQDDKHRRRKAPELSERLCRSWREQAFDDVAAVERGDREQVEDREEDVDQ